MDSGKKVKKKRQRRHSYKRGASHSREPKLWKPGEPLTPTDLDLLSGLQGAVYLPQVLGISPAQLLILENQEEPPGQGLPAAHILDEPDIALA